MGHGFFHTASLQVNGSGRTYRYVYDCGSVAPSLVESRVESYFTNEELELRKPELDMLVLSHFHVDHINGVPHLLSKFKVKKLVLPFLSEDFVLAALADLAASGVEAWTEFSGLVLNPQTWMQERGQGDAQVTQVRPDGPEGQDDRQNVNQNGDISLPPGEVNHRVMGTLGAPGDEYWDFKFYAHENWERYLLLLSALDAKFNPASEAAFLACLSDPAWIAAHHAEVTEVFRSLGSSNQNGITLCMYSGPRHKRIAHGYLGRWTYDPMSRHYFRDYDWRWRAESIGWLGTGDAELREPPLFDAFATHYQDFIGSVDTLTIPHHGSRENYCASLGEVGQCAVLTSDHEEDPDEHHPSPQVMVNLRTKRSPVFIVTREMGTALFNDGWVRIK